MNDDELLRRMARLPTAARSVLRRAARAEQFERDELAQRLLREPNGAFVSELIDQLSMSDEARRRVVRVLGELEARPSGGGHLSEGS